MPVNVNNITPQLLLEIIPTYDLRALLIADVSKWLHLEDETVYIEITTPAKETAVRHYLDKNKINVFNSNILELSCPDCEGGFQPLPDGVYKIKIFVCDATEFCYEVHYLRTIRAQLRLDQILIDLHLNCCLPEQTLLEKYLEVDLLFKSAHANVRDGNIEEGMCHFNKGIDLLEDLENCVEKSVCTSQNC